MWFFSIVLSIATKEAAALCVWAVWSTKERTTRVSGTRRPGTEVQDEGSALPALWIISERCLCEISCCFLEPWEGCIWLIPFGTFGQGESKQSSGQHHQESGVSISSFI